MSILILASEHDVHIRKVKEILEQNGQTVHVLNTSRFPQHISVTASALSQVYGLTYSGQEVVISGDEVTAVWVRRVGRPKSADMWGDQISQLTGAQYLLKFLLKTINSLNARFLPGKPDQVFFWEDKVTQIPIALEVGFQVPETLVTTDFRQVVSFFNRHTAIISKAATTFPSGTSTSTTKAVSADDLIYLQRVRNYPVIFQERVEKRADIRVAVIGDQLFASQIRTQHTSRGKVDWRAAFVREESVYELPTEIKEKCLALTRQMGLSYGAIDLVLTPEGKHVFIEINPGGQWMWMEMDLGLPLSQAVAEYLMAGRGGASQ